MNQSVLEHESKIYMQTSEQGIDTHGMRLEESADACSIDDPIGLDRWKIYLFQSTMPPQEDFTDAGL